MFNQGSSSGFTVPASDFSFQYQAPPIRQLKTSADGKTMKLVSLDTLQPPSSIRSSHEQESVNEGALALIQLCVSNPLATRNQQTKSILSKFTAYDNNDVNKTPMQSSDTTPFSVPPAVDMAAFKFPNPSLPSALRYTLPSHMTTNLIYQRKLLGSSNASSSSSILDTTQVEKRAKRAFEDEGGHLGHLLRTAGLGRMSKQKKSDLVELPLR